MSNNKSKSKSKSKVVAFQPRVVKAKWPVFDTPEMVIEDNLKEMQEEAIKINNKGLVFWEDGEQSFWTAFPTFSDAWGWLATVMKSGNPAKCWSFGKHLLTDTEPYWKEVKPI